MTTDKRWWFSWRCHEEDYRPIVWPLPDAWLGYWCSGEGYGYSNMVGWATAKDAEHVAALIEEGWPDWDGEWRIEPEEAPDPPGSRFPQPEWAEGRWGMKPELRKDYVGEGLSHREQLELAPIQDVVTLFTRPIEREE